MLAALDFSNNSQGKNEQQNIKAIGECNMLQHMMNSYAFIYKEYLASYCNIDSI